MPLTKFNDISKEIKAKQDKKETITDASIELSLIDFKKMMSEESKDLAGTGLFDEKGKKLRNSFKEQLNNPEERKNFRTALLGEYQEFLNDLNNTPNSVTGNDKNINMTLETLAILFHPETTPSSDPKRSGWEDIRVDGGYIGSQVTAIIHTLVEKGYLKESSVAENIRKPNANKSKVGNFRITKNRYDQVKTGLSTHKFAAGLKKVTGSTNGDKGSSEIIVLNEDEKVTLLNELEGKYDINKITINKLKEEIITKKEENEKLDTEKKLIESVEKNNTEKLKKYSNSYEYFEEYKLNLEKINKSDSSDKRKARKIRILKAKAKRKLNNESIDLQQINNGKIEKKTLNDLTTREARDKEKNKMNTRKNEITKTTTENEKIITSKITKRSKLIVETNKNIDKINEIKENLTTPETPLEKITDEYKSDESVIEDNTDIVEEVTTLEEGTRDIEYKLTGNEKVVKNSLNKIERLEINSDSYTLNIVNSEVGAEILDIDDEQKEPLGIIDKNGNASITLERVTTHQDGTTTSIIIKGTKTGQSKVITIMLKPKVENTQTEVIDKKSSSIENTEYLVGKGIIDKFAKIYLENGKYITKPLNGITQSEDYPNEFTNTKGEKLNITFNTNSKNKTDVISDFEFITFQEIQKLTGDLKNYSIIESNSKNKDEDKNKLLFLKNTTDGKVVYINKGIFSPKKDNKITKILHIDGKNYPFKRNNITSKFDVTYPTVENSTNKPNSTKNNENTVTPVVVENKNDKNENTETTVSVDENTKIKTATEIMNTITLPQQGKVIESGFNLPKIEDTTIEWSNIGHSDLKLKTDNGKVTFDRPTDKNEEVTLKAKVTSKDGSTEIKEFKFTVKAVPAPVEVKVEKGTTNFDTGDLSPSRLGRVTVKDKSFTVKIKGTPGATIFINGDDDGLKIDSNGTKKYTVERAEGAGSPQNETIKVGEDEITIELNPTAE